MAHELASLLAANVNSVTRELLGKPSSLTRNEIRYGRRGSLVIVRYGPKRGAWFDHESGEGGDLLALIMRVHGVDFRRALEFARDFISGGEITRTLPPEPSHNSRNASNDEERRRAFALKRWKKRRNYRGSPAQRYLVSRGLDIDVVALDHVLGWDQEAHAMLALMTDPVTAEPSGIHRTFLDNEARKIDRRMLGKQGVVRISPDDDVADALGICEGLEDALAVAQCGWRPIWAATSAGAIARFPVLRGVQSLSIFTDRDPVGIHAAKKCADHWKAEHREVVIIGAAV